MDHRNLNKKQSHPSKFIALVAFLVALAIPILLVKTFRDKDHSANSVSLTKSKYTASLQDEHGGDDDIMEEYNDEESVSEIADNALDTQPNDLSAIEQPLPSPKMVPKKVQKKDNEWQVIITKDGDTLADLFSKLKLPAKTLSIILKNNTHAKAISNIKPGQKLQFSIRNQTLEKLIIPLTPTQSIIISKQGDTYTSQIKPRDVSSHNHYVTATVSGSLYGTAKKMGIPYKLIQQMAKIFNWEIDFSRDVREGDRFTIVYKAFFIENKQVGTGEIIAVTYTTTKGKVHQAIRHTLSNGEADYFNENGQSLKKAFSRYPLKFSHISSTFNLNRMHPILKKRRPHKGVDLAASIGTPIRAVGDGRIASIGAHSGYGNMIKINHNGTYTTLYAHMLRFKKGLSKGSRVKRGEVIGYVGQTGLATGPHCHFEFHVHNHPNNPATVDLPRASPVPKADIASFKYNAGALLAHMKLFEEAHLASLPHATA